MCAAVTGHNAAHPHFYCDSSFQRVFVCVQIVLNVPKLRPTGGRLGGSLLAPSGGKNISLHLLLSCSSTINVACILMKYPLDDDITVAEGLTETSQLKYDAWKLRWRKCLFAI